MRRNVFKNQLRFLYLLNFRLTPCNPEVFLCRETQEITRFLSFFLNFRGNIILFRARLKELLLREVQSVKKNFTIQAWQILKT